jgi:translation initiation factor 2 beta subunit (eIF-2beta)/eIF-5
MNSKNITTVNIPRDTIDPHFRYKRIVVKPVFINKSGGQWLIPKNVLDTLSKNIERDKTIIQKVIQNAIHSPVRKTVDGIVFKTEKNIDDIIEDYILSDVLCRACGNPETIVQSDNTIYCRACGN